MQTARIVGLLGVFVLAFARIAQAEDTAATAFCRFETLGTFAAGAVIDGRTFRLDDGREVRLAGIEVAPFPASKDAPEPAGAAAKAALEKLLAGNKVALKKLGSASDRYGRLTAHAFVARDGAERWIQQDMVATGQARVAVRSGEADCARELLGGEKTARRARLGLWADPAYAIKLADDAAALLAERGRFTIVEGKVLSVRESGGTIYINFGRVWSRNLTVTILRRNARIFAAAGRDPKKLEGSRIRVRGWVEERGGPRIEAVRPEQIEIADQD
jgi:endonuclease YncB( thermonuclease family)